MTKARTDLPPESRILDTPKIEEIWGPSSMAVPQMNCSPSTPLATAGSSKPLENNSD